MEVKNVLWKNNDGTFYFGDGESTSTAYKQATAQDIATYEAQQLEASKPKEVSRAQFFAALILMGLDVIVDNAIMASGDKLLINDYKNRLTFRRDWPSFIAMATVLNFTSADIDALFELANAQ